MSRHTPWYNAAHRSALVWKRQTEVLPTAARADGHCYVTEGRNRKRIGPFPVCLPEAYAAHNLLPGIREEALRRFAERSIAWHMSTPGEGSSLPSTHLLDSQVQCVNVLLSLANSDGGLMGLVKQVVPDATSLVPIEDGSPVAFEWIGMGDYLGEGRGHPRRRGQFVTSVDALVVAEHPAGRTAILIEWKFTESYDKPVRPIGPGGTDRREVYRAAYQAELSPFTDKPKIDAFLHEPHYQLLRQALLADGMVRAAEFGIGSAVLLHAVPRGNRTLLATVPESLASYGVDLAAIWHRLLPGPRIGYAMVDTLEAISGLPAAAERYLGDSETDAPRD